MESNYNKSWTTEFILTCEERNIIHILFGHHLLNSNLLIYLITCASLRIIRKNAIVFFQLPMRLIDGFA